MKSGKIICVFILLTLGLISGCYFDPRSTVVLTPASAISSTEEVHKLTPRKQLSVGQLNYLKRIICAQKTFDLPEAAIIGGHPLCATDLRNPKCEVFLSQFDPVKE